MAIMADNQLYLIIINYNPMLQTVIKYVKKNNIFR